MKYPGILHAACSGGGDSLELKVDKYADVCFFMHEGGGVKWRILVKRVKVNHSIK